GLIERRQRPVRVVRGVQVEVLVDLPGDRAERQEAEVAGRRSAGGEREGVAERGVAGGTGGARRRRRLSAVPARELRADRVRIADRLARGERSVASRVDGGRAAG